MQEAHGFHVVHHNTLPREDVIVLLDHNVCSMTHPIGYLNRPISVAGVMFGVRQIAMVAITRHYS